jgi:threonine dehydratase
MKRNFNITTNAVEKAAARIDDFINHTPVEFCRILSRQLGGEIFFKMENWQKTGSFKIRGALNKTLTLDDLEKGRGVITASAGNHGLGVAYASELLKIKARIVLPVNASVAKIRKLSTFGCEVIQAGHDYDEAEDIAHQIEKDCQLSFVHAFDDPEIIAGQGTIAKELLDQLPNLDTVVIPIGGGGLVGGVASFLKQSNPEIYIVGVQPTASPAMKESLLAGKVVETPIKDTLADGLAGRFVSEHTLQLTNQYVDDVVLVTEQEIRQAIKFMIDETHLLVEGAAAAGLAAILSEKVKVENNKVCVLITGRNISSSMVAGILKDKN